MSLAKKCDICGSYYDFEKEAKIYGNSYKKANGISLEVIDERGDVEMTKLTMDCCPTCINYIHELIGDIKMASKSREACTFIAIREAYAAFILLRDRVHYDIAELDMNLIIGTLGEYLDDHKEDGR